VVNEQEEESSESVDEVDVDALIKERDELSLQVEALTGRLRTVSAAFQEKTKEVDETKKRLEKNNELTKSRLRGDVVSNIFTPFENLKRSLDVGQKSGMDEALLSGFQMVHDEFWSALQKLGLEEIPGVGSLFNPNIHEVLTTMPVADAVMNDTVVQVYENGYRINNTVVKTAKVIVGKYYAPPAPPEDEQPTPTDSETSDAETTSTDESSNDDEV
jgi:molecular chaperone GrpE